MITLSLHSPQAPAVVLGALQAHAGEWRASHLPEALRRARVLAVEATVHGSTCTLNYRRRWYGPTERALALRVHATVMAASSGTTVQVVARYEVRGPLLAAIGFGLVVGAAVVLSPFPAWLLVGLFGGTYAFPFLLARSMNRQPSRAGHPEADYLIRRVEDAVAVAGAANSPAPAS